MKFKKWLLNFLDSVARTFKSSDNIMKLLFALPALISIAVCQILAKASALCVQTGPTNIPYYLSAFFLFVSLLFSIVVLYVGISFGSKRKVSSFIIMMLFVLIYVISASLFLVITLTDLGIKNMDPYPTVVTQAVIIQCICLACCFAGVVFAATKIDPEYYKERN